MASSNTPQRPKCKLHDCDNPVGTRTDGLCRTHYVKKRKAEWLDNTDINNLGIVKWAQEVLPDFATHKSPSFHIELFHDLLRLYSPKYTNKYERLYEWIGFRESAKSTAANTIFTSYILAHNGETIKITVNGIVEEYVIDERTIVIISETAGSAEEFTVRIRDAFSTNEMLLYYYDAEIHDAIDNLTGQWTRACFKFNNCFVQAVGTGNQIRGKVKGASRPTLVIADDLYSNKGVITEEVRRKTKRWFYNELMNSVDNLRGKVVVLGTIVHEDTIVVELQNDATWITKVVPVMGYADKMGNVNLDIFHEFISQHTKVDWDLNICKLPFDEIEDKDQRILAQKEYFRKVQEEKDWQLRWPERINLYFIAIKYKSEVYNNNISGFYQEYFHQIQAPSDKRFRTDMFLTAPKYQLKYEHGHNWFKADDWYDGKWISCNIEFGVDIAGTGGDDAVITPVIALPDYRVIVCPQVVGKFSLRDDLPEEAGHDLRRMKVAETRIPNARTGLVDETFRWALRYRPSVIKVGVAGEEELIAREFRRVFLENRMYTISIRSRPQTSREGSKSQRILATLLPFYETRMVYHSLSLSKLEYQLEYLGRTKNDDCADSLECAFFNLSFPEKLNIEFFEKDKEQEQPSRYIPSYRNPANTDFNIHNNWREYF